MHSAISRASCRRVPLAGRARLSAPLAYPFRSPNNARPVAPVLRAMKQLINTPEHVVTESLDALIATHSQLNRLDGFPDIKARIRRAVLCAAHPIAIGARVGCMFVHARRWGAMAGRRWVVQGCCMGR